MTSGGRACVIGGQGALGRAVVEELRLAGWTVHAAGRRPRGKGHVRYLDLARDETLEPALRDVDLTISTVPDRGLAAERWVLEHGGTLVNCSHAPGGAAAAVGGDTKAAGSVLLNAGLVPGIANLVAADLLEKHTEADCLEVAFTILKEGTAGRGGAEFVHAGLASRRQHRVAKLPFPSFGELACIEIHEDEDCGFVGVAGSRRIENYLAFANRSANRVLRLLNALHLMQLLPKAALSAGSASRRELSREPSAIWIGARRGDVRLGASVVECEGDYRTTARAARSFAEMLMAKQRPGCFNPEDLFEFGDLMSLEDMGVRIATAS
jgi:hypothetical protein